MYEYNLLTLSMFCGIKLKNAIKNCSPQKIMQDPIHSILIIKKATFTYFLIHTLMVNIASHNS